MMVGPHDNARLVREIHELVHALWSGEASDQQRLRLEELVRENPAARQMYVDYIDDTVVLQGDLPLRPAAAALDEPVPDEFAGDLPPELELEEELRTVEAARLLAAESSAREGQLPFSAGGSAIEANDDAAGTLDWFAAHGSSHREPAGMQGHRSVQRGRPLAWAALGLLIALGGVVGGMRYAERLVAAPSVESQIAPQPVAKIVRSTNTSWKRGGKVVPLETGEWLVEGRYLLQEGIAQVEFSWGTEVTFEAPTEFEFSANGSHRLLHGQLVAKVSPEDTGFTIDTSAVEVIDLGTEFGLSASENGACEVHVFKGAVEARQKLGNTGGHTNALRLSAGEATGFGIQEVPVMPIVFNPKRFSRAWRVSSRVGETTGAVRFVHPAPASVVEGQAESNEAMQLFLEAESVRLPEPIATTIAEPGAYADFLGRSVWIPAGVEVDSYLIHFDPIGSQLDQNPVAVKGAVTFNRPILGIIARGDQLSASDCILAAPETKYVPAPKYERIRDAEYLVNCGPRYYIRGLSGIWNKPGMGHSPAPNDWVQLSADRRTLTLACTAGGEADQLRVLVAAAGDQYLPTQDARPARSPQPYLGRPWRVEETIEAEHFDLGGEGVAWHDNTPDALASIFRANESVELYGYMYPDRMEHGVCWAAAGEWLAYTIEVDQPGLYSVKAAVASHYGGGMFRCEFGAGTSTASLHVPLTRSGLLEPWSQVVESPPVRLEAGRHVMRVVMEQNNRRGAVGDFDWFRMERAP